ncbi:hypothetical protein CcCBS67573_g02644 [Chytriomyces confervae]|uniref:Uncharacterized protein n=1 Tax=Chytriomyces confervae TaxID=246404 RepID=A0A507FL90_9FUNG|nr:hypothetical protein CcCBS67573_g02644 [Chytriomyces confervae]
MTTQEATPTTKPAEPTVSASEVFESNRKVLQQHHQLHAAISVSVLAFRCTVAPQPFSFWAIVGYIACNGLVLFMFLWLRNLASAMVNKADGMIVHVGADLRRRKGGAMYAFDTMYVMWAVMVLADLLFFCADLQLVGSAVFPLYAGAVFATGMMSLFLYDSRDVASTPDKGEVAKDDADKKRDLAAQHAYARMAGPRAQLDDAGALRHRTTNAATDTNLCFATDNESDEESCPDTRSTRKTALKWASENGRVEQTSRQPINGSALERVACSGEQPVRGPRSVCASAAA